MRLDFDPVDRAEPPDMPPHLRNGNSTHFPQMLRMRLSATARLVAPAAVLYQESRS